MALQELNETQVAYVNETVRPMVERIVRIYSQLDAFVLESGNQQSPIANTADQLADSNGTLARTDAPALTGQNVAQLATFVGNMRDQINGVALDSLIALMVRDYETVVRS